MKFLCAEFDQLNDELQTKGRELEKANKVRLTHTHSLHVFDSMGGRWGLVFV